MSAPQPTDADALLAAVETALGRCIAAADQPAPADVQAVGGDVQRLAATFAEAPPNAEQAARIRRLRRLHEQLCLCLAQRRGELADRLAAMRKGKPAIRAYTRTSQA